MSARLRVIAICWLAALMLLGLECAASLLPLPRAARPLLLAPALAIAAIVAFGSMRLHRSPGLAKISAIAGLFWLLVLLTLGSVDPVTRVMYPVPSSAPAATR